MRNIDLPIVPQRTIQDNAQVLRRLSDDLRRHKPKEAAACLFAAAVLDSMATDNGPEMIDPVEMKQASNG